MRVVAAEYVSVDGRMEMEDPDRRQEEPGGWTAPFWNDALAKLQHEQLFASDGLLLGRVTFLSFAAVWPSVTDEDGFADRMNSLPKYVASRTLEEPLNWNGTLLQGGLTEAVEGLKEQTGRDLLIYGSGEIFNALARNRLIDEYRLMVHPIVLGKGKLLFADEVDRSGLVLADVHKTEKGVVTLIYQQAP
jgi:dihydrofolate reductase